MPAKNLMWLLPLFILSACSTADDNHSYRAATAKQVAAEGEAADLNADSVSLGSINASNRKMIRTADFQCRVPNVLHAVTLLEKHVKGVGGVVEDSRVDNDGDELKTIAFKPDSLKQVQVYHTAAFLTLRVPASMLDSITNVILTISDFVVSRRLSQQDVTLNYLANQLLTRPDDTRKRALALSANSRDVLVIQANDEERKERTISRTIENLKIMDDVAYATLSVSFSQPDQTILQTIVNPDYAIKVPFATQCSVAIQGGVDLLVGIVVGLLTIWPVLLILLTGFSIGLSAMKRRKKISGIINA